MELQHYVELKDMVHMATKLERQIKRRGSIRFQTNSTSSSSAWRLNQRKDGATQPKSFVPTKVEPLNAKLISVEDYSITFKLRWKRRNNAKLMKNEKRQQLLSLKKYIRKLMARHAYLKLLSAATFIQCCWMQVRVRKELQRLQREANELFVKTIGDSRTNYLKERGNDTIQERSDLDFGVKFSIV